MFESWTKGVGHSTLVTHTAPAPQLACVSNFPCVCVRGASTNTIVYSLQSARSNMSENFPVWSLTVGGPEVDPCWDSLFDWILWFLLSAKE